MAHRNELHLLSLLLPLLLFVIPTHSACTASGNLDGSITATLGGTSTSLGVYAAYHSSTGSVKVSGSSISSKGARIYLVDGCPTSASATAYHQFYLMDQTFSFTVNMSQVGCGCNMAFYFVSMPARDTSDNYILGSTNDYYCDANSVTGTGCPEVDMMEANNRAFAIATHKCTAASSHWTSCDTSGSSKKVYSLSAAAYGPGTNYTINTKLPFTVSMKLRSTSGVHDLMNVTLKQGTKAVSIAITDTTYLAQMTSAINAGMVAAASYWWGTMDWLDSPPCASGSTCAQQAGIISNIVFTGTTTSSSCTASGNFDGTMNITENGVVKKLGIYEAYHNNPIVLSGTSITLKGARAYFTDGCPTTASPTAYHKFYLMNTLFSYAVDVSQLSCGCNMALYFVAMPGRNASDAYALGTTSDYYCDANSVTGTPCPEVDVMEANAYGFLIAAHKCSNVSKHWTSCDTSGTGKRVYSLGSSVYGPGSSYTIDTTKPFVVTLNLHATSGKHDLMNVTLSQGTKATSITITDSTYLAQMTNVINAGMVLAVSYWWGTMDWLDSPPCASGSTCTQQSGTIYNIVVGGKSKVPNTTTTTTTNTTSCTASGNLDGSIRVGISGVTKALGVYEAYHNYPIVLSGTTMTIRGGRAYLTDGCPTTSTATASAYHKFYLMNTCFKFTVNMSQVSCGCNLAFYFVSMPGRDTSDNLAPGSTSDYYCDANYVTGTGCPEIDMMEANAYAFQIATHKCTAASSHWTSCDGSGSYNKVYSVSSTAYGPGSSYKIDTTKTFDVLMKLRSTSGSHDLMNVTLIQGSKSVSITITDTTYLAQMTGAINGGMVAVVSHWWGSMDWLNTPPCASGSSCSQLAGKISNIVYGCTQSVPTVDEESSSSTQSNTVLDSVSGVVSLKAAQWLSLFVVLALLFL